MTGRGIGAIAVAICVAWGIGCAEEGHGGRPVEPSSPAADPGVRERAITVTMRVAVGDPRGAASTARTVVTAHGGYVARASETDDGAHLELRAPADALDDVRTALGDLGDLVSSTDEAEDVTLAHADQTARLASARAEEARLAAMFETRTTALADVLAVEHELTRVRGEIERLDAEERAMRDRIAMARVTLDLVRVAPGFTDAPIAFLARSASAGIDAAGAIGLATAGAIVALAPTALGIAAIVLAVRRLRRSMG
jgi:hypothetical protein